MDFFVDDDHFGNDLIVIQYAHTLLVLSQSLDYTYFERGARQVTQKLANMPIQWPSLQVETYNWVV